MIKKVLTAAATGFIIAGVTVSSVSAAEVEVHKGDTLWGIAQEHNITTEKLMSINNLQDSTIHPNQILKTSKEEVVEYYTVKKGDTLSGIGKDFSVSVANLKKWNDLDSDLILIGQELALHGQNSETAQPATKQKKVVPKKEKIKAVKEPVTETTGETISVTATAYTAKCDGCSGVTATGVDLNANPDAKVIAVDPNVIPLGSNVYVDGYGYATAADTGGAIKGNKIDIHVPNKDQANEWGVKKVNVTIVE